MDKIAWRDFTGAPGNRLWKETEAASARGWLFALSTPYSTSEHWNCPHNRMPIQDDVPGGWREQTSLGHYLDYEGKDWSGDYKHSPDGEISAVSVVGHTSKWFPTVESARQWLLEEAKTHRPELFT